MTPRLPLSRTPRLVQRLPRALRAVAALSAWWGCHATPVAEVPGDDRPLSTGLHGLNFGPFVDGADPNLGATISEARLRQLLGMVRPYTSWVRTFGSGGGLERTGAIAHELGMKVACGAWLGRDLAANDRELASLVTSARSGHCDIAIVGSEVLLRRDLTEDQVVAYVRRVQRELQGMSIPVTSADTWGVLLANAALVAAVDVVFVNYYPYWEGVAIDRAVATLDSWHERMITAAPHRNVIVSETGWPGCTGRVGDAEASPENAVHYFLSFVTWARSRGVTYFYFEAMDEPFKAKYEGPTGACWGILDGHGRLKPGMEAVFRGLTGPGIGSAGRGWSRAPLVAAVETARAGAVSASRMHSRNVV